MSLTEVICIISVGGHVWEGIICSEKSLNMNFASECLAVINDTLKAVCAPWVMLGQRPISDELLPVRQSPHAILLQ